MSSIEWTNETWNPIVGCSKVSAGCQNCYAIPQSYRNAAMGAKLENPGRLAYYEGLTEKRGDRVEWTGKVNFVPEALEIPLKTRKPTTWFVNSMSDLFHESVTDEQLDQIFAVMALTPQHTYQVLTKRPERMLEYMQTKDRHGKVLRASKGNPIISSGMYPLAPHWPLPNCWLGVTVENQKAADERIPLLLQTPAVVRFLSCEPLLEGIDLINASHAEWKIINLLTGATPYSSSACNSISWVIVGGESGHGARPCNVNWIRSIVEQCAAAEVPCFVKQLGSNPFLTSTEVIASVEIPKRMGVRVTGKGGNPDEWPKDLRVRQFPTPAT